MSVTVWFNPSCSKCIGARGLLEERALEVAYVHYLDTPPARAEIQRVLGLLGTQDPRALARTREPLWTELGLDTATPDEILDALAAHPSLIERPVVIMGDRAVVARPPELLLDLLG